MQDVIARAEKALDFIERQRKGGETPHQGKNAAGHSSLVSLSASDLRALVDAAKASQTTVSGEVACTL